MMYSFEEAEAEHDAFVAEGNGENNSRRVIHEIDDTARPKATKKLTRSPSFFRKMFSSRKLNRVLNDDQSLLKEEDETASGDKKKTVSASNGGNNDADDDGTLETNEEDDELRGGERDVPGDPLLQRDLSDTVITGPPLPFLGKPVKVDRLVTRNKTAELGMEALMGMVMRDANTSLFDANRIPVSKESDRVTVTAEISNYMGKVKSKKGIEKKVKDNMTTIQKSLNYRKSAIIIMNSNYSQELVRKIEPIYTKEARTIITFK
jgi:hypothetical protein